MSTPLVFMDTETTGLSIDDDIWEFGAIRREPDGAETEHHYFVQHDGAKCAKLPPAFYEDHERRFNAEGLNFLSQPDFARIVARLFTDRPHIVGAVPNFDTERLAKLLAQFGRPAGWHYHLIDVENLAVGFLGGVCKLGGAAADGSSSWLGGPPKPPWKSDDLSSAVGVDPEQFERHTAMGDVRWAMAIYDAVMGS